MTILFTFLTEKKTVLDQYEVCLLNFHQQIIVISSQNNVRKYCTRGHEQVFCLERKNWDKLTLISLWGNGMEILTTRDEKIETKKNVMM